MTTTQLLSTEIFLDGFNFPEGRPFDQKRDLCIVEWKAENLTKINRAYLVRFKRQRNPDGIAIDSNLEVLFSDAVQKSLRMFHPSTAEFESNTAGDLVVFEAENRRLVSVLLRKLENII